MMEHAPIHPISAFVDGTRWLKAVWTDRPSVSRSTRSIFVVSSKKLSWCSVNAILLRSQRASISFPGNNSMTNTERPKVAEKRSRANISWWHTWSSRQAMRWYDRKRIARQPLTILAVCSLPGTKFAELIRTERSAWEGCSARRILARLARTTERRGQMRCRKRRSEEQDWAKIDQRFQKHGKPFKSDLEMFEPFHPAKRNLLAIHRISWKSARTWKVAWRE